MTAEPPLVSVITPTRNRAKLLEETLDSVAAQTLSAWEHLVIDDGSDDGTGEMMAARTAADPRVSYIVRQSPPAGGNACRNVGIRKARAPLVVLPTPLVPSTVVPKLTTLPAATSMGAQL